MRVFLTQMTRKHAFSVRYGLRMDDKWDGRRFHEWMCF